MTKHCKSCRRDLEEAEFIEIAVFKTCNSCRKRQNGNNRKFTIEECQEFAKSKGGKCLSTEYKNNQTTMLWRCEKKHEWNAMFQHIKRGVWCPHCSGKAKHTIQDCQLFAESKGGSCLSTEYSSNKKKMRWKCEKKHEWSAIFKDIKHGYWCPSCAGVARLTIEECQSFAESKGGKCLSTEYKNCSTKMLWQCEKKHEWSTIYSRIKHSSWCPRCSGNRSEELCRTIIENYLCEPFPNVRPKFLEGLELDGYNKDLNIAFEYNGIQHYEYNEHFHRGDPELFEKQKERDLKKYAICAERGIDLIIIPYQYDYSKPKELENFIFNALWKIS